MVVAKMKIGLIDVDGHNFPNLPLMKLSAWHKSRGDQVEWYDPWKGFLNPYDKVYMSKVFSFTDDYDHPIYAREVEKGGSGYCISLVDGKEMFEKSKDRELPYEIEHIYPDYTIYEITDTAYGFLTRGCPRGCGFCHVASKEGRCSYKVANLDEFWHGQKNIVLCDPNILACKEHMDLLRQLAESGAKVNFNQGIDIRLLNETNAKMLTRIKTDIIHFAFDRYQDKDIIEPRLRLFREKSGYDHHKVEVYILTNYDTTIEQDLYRINLCRELDFQPYPMIYDKEHADSIHKQIQRWCNPFIFWSTEKFEDYKGGNEC